MCMPDVLVCTQGSGDAALTALAKGFEFYRSGTKKAVS